MACGNVDSGQASGAAPRNSNMKKATKPRGDRSTGFCLQAGKSESEEDQCQGGHPVGQNIQYF
jgi:hypothetical protein